MTNHASNDQAAVRELSIVIPVYNEESILVSSVRDMISRLDAHGIDFQIILAENGSKDRTVALGRELEASDRRVTIFSHPEPNYGGALRAGIERAEGTFVICEEIDLCDVDFHLRALELLRSNQADFVVGSKAMHGSGDHRPLIRRVATRSYNQLLRISLGYRGTDTHGLKAFRRATVLPYVRECIVEHDVFASELVIRAQRGRVRVVEIPVDISERRAPSVRLAKRVPRVLKNLGKLMLSIHGGRATLGRADAGERKS